MPRRLRYHHTESDSDEFETPALREAERVNRENAVEESVSDDDDYDEKSESGLGDSPEDEMIDENADSDEVGSDSDDAPEDVGFTSSRETEKKRMQSILQQIRKGRDELKEKRRKKDELFKLQKQDKLAALSKRKLPADILEAVAGKPAKQRKSAKDAETGESQESENDGAKPSSTPAATSDDAGDETGSGASDEEDGNASGLLGDFVPLEDPDLSTEEGDLAVVALSAEKRKAGPVSHSVADFKQRMLYSGRNNRISSQQLRAAQAKRKARK